MLSSLVVWPGIEDAVFLLIHGCLDPSQLLGSYMAALVACLPGYCPPTPMRSMALHGGCLIYGFLRYILRHADA